MAAMESHPSVVCEKQTDACLPCLTGMAKIPQTHWWCKGTGAPPPDRHRPPTPQLTPPTQPGHNEGVQAWQIERVPPRYLYIHTSLSNAQFFNFDAYAKYHKHDKDFIPDLLTDKRTCTGWYTLGCMVMKLVFSLPTRAAYWENIQVETSIDRKERDFWVHYDLQLVDNLKYILQDIFICIIKEKCSDKGESTWRWYKGCQNTSNDIQCQIKWLHVVDMLVMKWASTEVHDFWSCESGSLTVIWSLLYIIKTLAAFIGNRECDTHLAPSWK